MCLLLGCTLQGSASCCLWLRPACMHKLLPSLRGLQPQCEHCTCCRFQLAPGDIQLLHNHQILHARSAFTDWPEPERKRHLLRLWLSPANGRPLPQVFAERYGSTEPGHRGGIRCPGVTPYVPLDAIS